MVKIAVNSVMQGVNKLPPAASKLFYQVTDKIAFLLCQARNADFSCGKIVVMENNNVTFQTNKA